MDAGIEFVLENWPGFVVLGVALIVGTFWFYTMTGKNRPWR
jgi:hypothetical protein